MDKPPRFTRSLISGLLLLAVGTASVLATNPPLTTPPGTDRPNGSCQKCDGALVELTRLNYDTAVKQCCPGFPIVKPGSVDISVLAGTTRYFDRGYLVPKNATIFFASDSITVGSANMTLSPNTGAEAIKTAADDQVLTEEALITIAPVTATGGNGLAVNTYLKGATPFQKVSGKYVVNREPVRTLWILNPPGTDGLTQLHVIDSDMVTGVVKFFKYVTTDSGLAFEEWSGMPGSENARVVHRETLVRQPSGVPVKEPVYTTRNGSYVQINEAVSTYGGYTETRLVEAEGTDGTLKTTDYKLERWAVIKDGLKVLKQEILNYGSPQALINTYQYGEDPADTKSFGRPIIIQKYGEVGQKIVYLSQPGTYPEITKTVYTSEVPKDLPPTPDTIYNGPPPAPLDPSVFDSGHRVVVETKGISGTVYSRKETFGDQLISESWTTRTNSGTGFRDVTSVRTSAQETLQTVTEYYGGAATEPQTGQVKSVVNPDGTVQRFS